MHSNKAHLILQNDALRNKATDVPAFAFEQQPGRQPLSAQVPLRIVSEARGYNGPHSNENISQTRKTNHLPPRAVISGAILYESGHLWAKNSKGKIHEDEICPNGK